MTDPIDFTLCQRLPNRAYNGANGKKIAISYVDDVWMLKCPPLAAEKPTVLKQNGKKISYMDFIVANKSGVLASLLSALCRKST